MLRVRVGVGGVRVGVGFGVRAMGRVRARLRNMNRLWVHFVVSGCQRFRVRARLRVSSSPALYDRGPCWDPDPNRNGTDHRGGSFTVCLRWAA